MKQSSANKITSNKTQPPSGGCVLKHYLAFRLRLLNLTAAFRRLCVETIRLKRYHADRRQPPSGGCVLKLGICPKITEIQPQPPSGGCVLKQLLLGLGVTLVSQPPSGGCVLKLFPARLPRGERPTAAFRRLCVETPPTGNHRRNNQTAAFRRLCVETLTGFGVFAKRIRTAAFRRLCVETQDSGVPAAFRHTAAFRRLCVETLIWEKVS